MNHTMSHTTQIKRLPPVASEALLSIMETLPGALFVVDDTTTIVYANASAQSITGATREELVGKPLWSGAPHLVSTALYQAVQKTLQTRAPIEVEYRSPMKETWLHAQLVPTVDGLLLHVHEKSEPLPHQETVFSEERIATDVLENLYIEIGVLTLEGVLLEINEAPLADAQIRREEVIGKPFAETPWWTHYPTSQEQLRAAIVQARRGETVRFETLIHLREGIDLYLEAMITPHRNVDHQIEYLVYVGTDITARKRADADIHALIDTIPQLVWIARPDGSCEYTNRRWCDYTGLSPEQAQGDGWLQCLHPEDGQHVQRIFAEWLRTDQTGGVYETEHRLRQHTTGAYRRFLLRAMPMRDEAGQIVKWFGTCTDIEEQKRAEQQLKESWENWRMLAETVPQLVWVIRSDDWRHEYVNQHWCDYFGLTLEYVQSDPWAYRQFIHPEDRESERACVQHAMDTGTMFEHEQRLRKSQTGEYRWFLARAMPMRDEAGQIIKWFGTSTDIDERKRIEEALHQSQKRIRALIDSNIIGIASVEMEGEVIVESNEALSRMMGYTREDMLNRTLTRARLTPPQDAPLFERAIQELTTRGQHTPFETEMVCKDGSRLPILLGGVIFQDHPSQYVAFVLDNSARKELEQRKDAFISMASHELRNPLAALKLQTTLLRRQLAKQDILDKTPALAGMENQIKAITRLVEELLDVSRIQAGKLEYIREPVDLDTLLREITDTIQQIHPSHRILVRGAAQASLIGDRDRLGQVFINLIGNAIKYSPSAETVEIDLSSSEEAITVQVRDHGLGIPREQCDKIFERFYRVAGPKQKAIPGLGMGLYIVAEIVKHHGGTIAVESEIGKGSTFSVTLPRKRDA